MALVNINFTVLAHAYVLYARALQSRIRGGTFAAPVSQEILSQGNFVARQNFLGKSVAATIFPRKFCRSILTQRPHFLGNSVALLHRDTLPRSTAEFDIGGGTRGHWGPVPPLMSREEAASYIGNAVAALK